MRVTIFGTGYVGLVTGACLADAGNDVLCIDIDAQRISRLDRGEIPFHEPGLDALVKRNLEAGRIRFTTDAQKGVAHGLFQMIAVGTPSCEDGSADLQHVLDVARTIGKHLDGYAVVVIKSTAPVGTAEKLRHELEGELRLRDVEAEVDVVSNPEFLKQGAAISDFMRPDRVVVGTDNPRTMELLRILYEPFTHNHERFVVMDIRSAELTKYAANAMLATRISLMNELANIAERVGADIESVRLGIGSDPRIGYNFIYPGTGYGGSCFPKDVRALVRTAGDADYRACILEAVEEVNGRQKAVLMDKLHAHFSSGLAGLKVALWGLSFKPNTDDMREAPARVVMEHLWKAGATVAAYDPAAMDEARRLYAGHPGLELASSAYAATEGADALVIVTEWREFRSPDFERLRKLLKQPAVFDGRNLYNPNFMHRMGFHYYPVGRRHAARSAVGARSQVQHHGATG